MAFKGEEVRLWNWAREWQPGDPPMVLEGQDFDECNFIGPGVLMFIGGVSFVRNKVDGDALWVVDPHRGYQGAIAVRNCSFMACTFVNVGIATDEAFVREIYGTQAGAR
jgi:hypothetical protein